ncbi:MAG: LuxR C-terminal-related transcriptional regulator, partial [Acidimicrobiales bacterium]
AYEILTSIELALGRPEEADRWAAAAERLVQTQEALPLETASALRARVAVLLASGCDERAAELARVATEMAAGSRAPVEAGRSRLLLGRALANAGAREAAIVELERAEADLEACGALGYRDQAVSELARLGRRRARRAGPAESGLQSLTARESEIARLVSAGRTNRQIAKACNVSEKTVERHLTNIYVKLGLTSRAALSSLVARGDLSLS